MQYLEGEQTLRNKDYITITRNDHSLYQNLKLKSQQLDLKEKRLNQLEVDLNKKEQEISKKAKLHKYDLNKKIRKLADDILKME